MPARDRAPIPDTAFRRRAFLGITLAVGLVLTSGLLARVDLAWLDARLEFRRLYHSEDTVPGVVLVAADEASLRQITEPLALWHRPLARALERLARLRPRAVGIDLALPERSYDALLPGGDTALAAALARLRQSAPLVLALGADGETGHAQAIHPLFVAAAGVENNGLAYFPRDADGAVRRFSEALGEHGEELPTLAGQIARRLGTAVRPGIIDFSRGPAFDYLPLHRLVAPDAPGGEAELERRIAGQIVLLGTALPYLDRHTAPLNLAAWETGPDSPGLVLQAQALRSLLGETLITPTGPSLQLVLVVLMSGLGLLPLSLRALASAAFSLAGALAVASMAALDAGIDLPLTAPLLALASVLATRIAWQAAAARRTRRRLLATFGGFVSPPVLEALLDEQLDPAKPQRRHLVFLFADLRDFGGLTATLPPEQVFALLNRYYSAITPALHAHGATIDNFRGDGLMAFFGAPQDLPAAETAAIAGARAVLHALAALNRELSTERLPALRLGIALAAGEAVVGNVGDQRRNNYTALADSANLAAHLQGIARNFDSDIIATGELVTRRPEGWRSLGLGTIKDGRQIEVFGLDHGDLQNPQ